MVKLLFDRKYVSVKGRDAYHHTPLHWAIQEDRLGIVKFLLDEGADIEAKDLGGWTSIYYAIYKNNFDILKFLIDNGADIEAKDINDETPLHIAVKDNNKPEVIRLLLDNGARIEAKNKGGWTPLHYAAYKDNLDACKLLLGRNADVEAKNTYDETPLHVAAENSNKSKVTVELLLDTGANINAKNKDGWVPLHYAAYKDNLDICKLLLERDASIEAKTNDDRTPLDIANYMKHSDVVEYLKKVKEERGKPVQRRRRHHHGDHNHHGHLSRNLLAIDLSNQPEIATSNAARPSSWINNCISWVKKLAASTFSTIPGLPTQYNIAGKNDVINVKGENNNAPKSISAVGWNNFLNSENVALASCVADALDNTPSRRYQNLISKGVEVVPSSRVAVEFALKKFSSFVEGKIRNLDSKEQARIRVELKDAYPEITASLERGVEFSGNIGLDDVLEKCKKCFCTNVLPKDKISTCLSDVGVTKLGNNLSR